uniref:thialysine N-epsilon-acetyltransferase-like n=1 Tax=Euleptes europaea TaxID=460621 RepID=UPI0025400A07|nr:thialysine N-epsilon-acetyltransferase-like [Euleptes europaea]
MECVIRQATREDCDPLMGLMREIAEFHHLLDEVTINSQVLKTDGFGEDPFFKCILAELPAEKGGKAARPIGFALYFFGYSVLHGRIVFLESLYVASEFRGKGIGVKLLGKVAEIALAAGCKEVRFVAMEWNSPAKDFYLRLGAKDMTQSHQQWHSMELSGEALQRLAQKGRRSPGGALGSSSGQAQQP